MRIVFAAVAAPVGLILGSAMNLVIYRLPRELTLVRRPHSTCCRRPLTWEVVPLLGFLLQRGRCRHCDQPIPLFFPLVELLTAVVFALLFWRHYEAPLLASLYALFSLFLILTLFIDWLHHDVYYLIIIPAVAVALLGSLLRLDSSPNFLCSLFGMGVGLVSFGVLFAFGHILFHTEALGLGDVWLAGTIGAISGFPGSLFALALGMIFAGIGGGLFLLFRRGSSRDFLPYGAFLCLGALAYLCFSAPWECVWVP